jgi:hypothetical protein
VKQSSCDHALSEKLKFLREVEQIGSCATAREFDVSESCIQDRRNRNIFFFKIVGTNRLFMGKRQFSDVEEKLS